MLSPQQKTTTLVKILFRAAHTYSKDSKKKVSGKLVKKSGRPNSHYWERIKKSSNGFAKIYSHIIAFDTESSTDNE